MADVIKIEGLEELKKELRQFPEQLQKKALDKSVRAGSRIIVKAARNKAPKRAQQWEGMKYPNPPGTLKKGIKAEKARRMPVYFRRDIIGFSPIAWYGALDERGHKIVRGGTLAGGSKRRKTSGLPFDRKGRPTTSGQGRVIAHAAARPFLRPAFDENQGKVIDAMKEKLGQEIGKLKMTYLKAK